MKRLLIGIGIIAVVGIGGFFLYQQFQPDDAVETADPVSALNTAAVETGVDIVSAEGQLLPLRSADLSFQGGGVVSEIVVAEGDTVQAGAPLIRLEATDLEIAVSQAEAGLVSAQGNLASAQTQLEQAQMGVNTAQIGVTLAEAQLALVLAGPLPEEIAALENNIAAAEASINQAAGNRDASLNISDAQVRAAEANVAASMANYESIQDTYDAIIDACYDTPDGEVCPLYGPVEESTRFQLQIAELELNSAQAALDSLLAGPTLAAQRAANGSVALAVAQRDAAQAQLDLLLAGPTPEQIEQSEVGVAQAELGVLLAETAVAQAEAAVAQAEAGVVQAQAQLDTAQAALDRMTLMAPFAGTVGQIMVELGELVAPNVPVATLADTSTWQVETTDLTELDVVAVAVGYPVEVRVDALPDEIIMGMVSDIAVVSTLARGDVTYAATIDLENTDDLPLRWGMTVFVDVDVSQ